MCLRLSYDVRIIFFSIDILIINTASDYCPRYQLTVLPDCVESIVFVCVRVCVCVCVCVRVCVCVYSRDREMSVYDGV